MEVLYDNSSLNLWQCGGADAVPVTLVVPGLFSTDAAGFNGGPGSPSFCAGSNNCSGDFNYAGEPINPVTSCASIAYVVEGPDFNDGGTSVSHQQYYR